MFLQSIHRGIRLDTDLDIILGKNFELHHTIFGICATEKSRETQKAILSGTLGNLKTIDFVEEFPIFCNHKDIEKMGIRERCEHYAKIKTPHRQIPLTTVKNKITIYDLRPQGNYFSFLIRKKFWDDTFSHVSSQLFK